MGRRASGSFNTLLFKLGISEASATLPLRASFRIRLSATGLLRTTSHQYASSFLCPVSHSRHDIYRACSLLTVRKQPEPFSRALATLCGPNTKTCNVSRTVMTQTQGHTYSMSNQCGKRCKCSVRFTLFWPFIFMLTCNHPY